VATSPTIRPTSPTSPTVPPSPLCRLSRAQIQEGALYIAQISNLSKIAVSGQLVDRWSHYRLSMGGIGQLHQRVTIGTLPDDVLLKVFKSFVNETYFYYTTSEEWRMLVHVCRRWRNLAFTFPRHLGLQLLFRPPKRSMKRMLDIWPELLIYIHARDCSTKEVRDNVAAALRLNHRVSRIRLEGTSGSAWETFVPLMNHSFPALTHFLVQQSYRPIKNAMSRSFLGGSAPSLRELYLDRVPFPALPGLLLSATNLVRFWHDNIPRSGYISPQAMVTGLSALTRLESLSLTFQTAQSPPDTAIRIPPPHARTLLPSLTYLRFRGVPEYIGYLVAQIHDPLLESMEITFCHQEVLEISELAEFIRRADKLSLVDPKALVLNPACVEWVLRLSYLVHFCASCLPTPSAFECLHIRVPFEYMWQDVIADPDRDAQWLEFLRPFNAVNHLHLSQIVDLHIAQALRRLPSERVMEVLPALQSVFISGLKLFGPVKEAMTEFVDARQLSGHPVSIYNWEGRVRFAL